MKTLSRGGACPETEQSPAPAQAPATNPRNRKPKRRRESVESFVVVFFSFLLWSLEAEGFVIPTGSMAPTLMGRHKEVSCPQCGFVYAVNASEEVESRGAARESDEIETAVSRYEVSSGLCVNCRYLARSLQEAPSFKGDRILVMMFPY